MTINEIQDEIIEEFDGLDDWMDRYQMLIDLGNDQEPLDEKYKIEQNLINGCQSRVWLQADYVKEQGADGQERNVIRFTAESDALIVKGYCRRGGDFRDVRGNVERHGIRHLQHTAVEGNRRSIRARNAILHPRCEERYIRTNLQDTGIGFIRADSRSGERERGTGTDLADGIGAVADQIGVSIAEEVSGEALSLLVLNKLKGVLL